VILLIDVVQLCLYRQINLSTHLHLLNKKRKKKIFKEK
jgi:hypothetical protein